MITPIWASELLLDALKYLDCPARPNLVWRSSKKHILSSGCAYKDKTKIVVTAGSSVVDQKVVLLHEIAHIYRPKKESHSIGFWRTAWNLFEHYGLDLPSVLKRESRRKKECKKQYDFLFSNK